MSVTKIEWTDRTWNPVRGCSRVSEGCRNCYAERVAARFSGRGGPFQFFADKYQPGSKWTGKVELVSSKLDEPLRWRKPARVFVNSMSDLFHEKLSDRDILMVFDTMAAAPQHTFQVLTKRPRRMLEWFSKIKNPLEVGAFDRWAENLAKLETWPLPNAWLGVSVEDQKTADERIPLLLDTPAAVRFVSYEPALGPVDFSRWIFDSGEDGEPAPRNCKPGIDWIIVGGESGPGARPCDVEWIRSAVEQARAALVPVFVKQLGARPVELVGPHRGAEFEAPIPLRDRKGGDPSEWPEALRVREMPKR